MREEERRPTVIILQNVLILLTVLYIEHLRWCKYGGKSSINSIHEYISYLLHHLSNLCSELLCLVSCANTNLLYRVLLTGKISKKSS
jgi:hypothetical protein